MELLKLGCFFRSSVQISRFDAQVLNVVYFKYLLLDVAIGAPYENNGEGVVYIYNGYSGGLWSAFTQRITGGSVDPGIRSFGAALTPQSNTLSDGMKLNMLTT